MAGRQSGRRIAILTANEGLEEVELTEPRRAVEQEGATVELLAPETGDIQTFNHRPFNHLDMSAGYRADRAVTDAEVGDHDGLALHGCVANPDALHQDDGAVGSISDFVTGGRPVAVICHGRWTLIEAGVLGGRALTSWPSLQTDIRKCEWRLAGRGGRRRREPDLESQARRPSGLLRHRSRPLRSRQRRRVADSAG